MTLPCDVPIIVGLRVAAAVPPPRSACSTSAYVAMRWRCDSAFIDPLESQQGAFLATVGAHFLLARKTAAKLLQPSRRQFAAEFREQQSAVIAPCEELRHLLGAVNANLQAQLWCRTACAVWRTDVRVTKFSVAAQTSLYVSSAVRMAHAQLDDG